MIQSKITETKKQEKQFPKLMKCSETGVVALMTEKEKGVVLTKGDGITFHKGEWWGEWDMGLLEDFEGEITLSNKS